LMWGNAEDIRGFDASVCRASALQRGLQRR
jgi:hypothetical protein